jgi:GDP-D-mannose 3',5'-epimerase
MKYALVLGAGGFIGSHMVERLKSEGFWVRGVDLKENEFRSSNADEFILGDLRDPQLVSRVLINAESNFEFDEIYQFAADMGGAGFVFTGENDADIMHNSATINLNVLNEMHAIKVRNPLSKTKIFYSGSACMYPAYNQEDPDNPNCKEDSAYPADPDSEYGWEKLFSERLYFAYHRNYGIPVAVARYHNIFGPFGTWEGGREKAPAAISRKVASVSDGGEIEIWGDGNQTRSFLFIDECIEATRRFMTETEYPGPLNIGSEEMVTINTLVKMVCEIDGKTINVQHIKGPEGVRGRNSDNTKIKEILNWNYKMQLKDGLGITYKWISDQIKQRGN